MVIGFLLPTGVIIFLCWASYFADSHYLYKKVYWFFEFCHLSAGFFVAAFLANILNLPELIVVGTLVVGVLWELYELADERWKYFRKLLGKHETKHHKMTWSDTLLDLALDTLGAVLYTTVILK